MPLVDRSPGRFLLLVFAVAYAVIGVEAWMYAVATLPAVVGTFLGIAACAAAICRWTFELLEDADGEPVATPDLAPVASVLVVPPVVLRGASVMAPR